MQIKSDDAVIPCRELGRGPDVVFAHPFPSSHEFWLPVAERLADEYHCVLVDLRGMGQSETGEGPATMRLHAQDILRVCDELGVKRAAFAGCSIGGYVVFELWRQAHDRFRAMVLADTKSSADTDIERVNRLKMADRAEQEGPEPIVEAMMPKLVGESTLRNRPDIVAAVRATTARSTGNGLAANLRGMAEREDSTPTLATVDVPTLVIGGAEDVPSPRTELERMARGIRVAELKILERCGHFAAFEQPEEFTAILRDFLRRSAR